MGAGETGEGGPCQVMEGSGHAKESRQDLARTVVKVFSEGLQLGHRKCLLVAPGRMDWHGDGWRRPGDH